MLAHALLSDIRENRKKKLAGFLGTSVHIEKNMAPANTAHPENESQSSKHGQDNKSLLNLYALTTNHCEMTK